MPRYKIADEEEMKAFEDFILKTGFSEDFGVAAVGTEGGDDETGLGQWTLEWKWVMTKFDQSSTISIIFVKWHTQILSSNT